MAKISEGISAEVKEKMVNVLERKKEEAKNLKESIAREAQKIVNEGTSGELSSFWLNGYLTKLSNYNMDLAKLEGEMQLLTVYSQQNKNETENK